MSSALSLHPQYHTEVRPLSKAPNPHCSVCVGGLGRMGYTNWVGSYTNFFVDRSKCCYIIDNRILDFFEYKML